MLDFKRIPLSLLDANTGQIPGLPANPRLWTDAEVRRLAKSMKDTPELAEARGCVVVPFEGRYVILGGNLRREAAICAVRRRLRSSGPTSCAPCCRKAPSPPSSRRSS